MKTVVFYLISVFAGVNAWAGAPPAVDAGCKYSAPATPAIRPCDHLAINYVVGDTLYVEGLIDPMLYNLLKAEGLENKIHRVELNSPGGSLSLDYPYLVADIIREKGMTTSLREGAVCASSCVILYQAGAHRVANDKSVFVFHSPFIRSAETDYLVGCIGDGPDGDPGTEADCAKLKQAWYDASKSLSDQIFAYLENHGASPDLYQEFLKQPKDDHWVKNHNALGIQEWWLPASGAQAYGVVQDIVQ